MKLQMKGISSFLLCCVMLSGAMCATAQAKSDRYKQVNHFELIGALGVANLKAGNSNLGVTSIETDKLVQTNSNNWATPAAQLGVGYVYYFHQSKKPTKNTQWFPAVEPQLNVYFLNGNNAINGNVWRYGSSAYNQLNYNMPVRSTRLMLDAALTVVKKKQSSLYVKAGIGNAWNRIGYNDSDNGTSPDCVFQSLSLNTQTRTHFAWELGLGILHDFNNNVGMSLEYLYANFGKVKTSSSGNYGLITTPTISPASFTLQAQTLSLGLHFAL